MHPPLPAMRHTEVFQAIDWRRVMVFLPAHEQGWWIDKHFNQCGKQKGRCPCCWANLAMSHSFSCEVCTGAWRLSCVSKFMRGEVVAHGRALPRWSIIEPCRKRGYKPQPAVAPPQSTDDGASNPGTCKSWSWRDQPSWEAWAGATGSTGSSDPQPGATDEACDLFGMD